MTGIPDDWQLHLAVVWQPKHLSIFCGSQRGLLRLSQLLELLQLCNVLRVQLGAQRIDVEEWVFPMVHLSCWHSVCTLEALIAHRGQVHVGALLGDLNSLELGVMEVVGVADVLQLGRVHLLLQLAEVALAELSHVFGGEGVLDRVREALVVLPVDRLGGRLREALSIQILTGHLGNVASVPRNVLGLEVAGGSSDPVLAGHRGVTVLQLSVNIVLGRRVDMEVVFVELRLANSNFDVVLRGLDFLVSDKLINVSSRASEDLVLLWHVAGVPWQIVLIVFDESFGRHLCNI